jgi:hypothetical protein
MILEHLNASAGELGDGLRLIRSERRQRRDA